jgi:S-DNA-T family DNA segregation ATPase FtsK/SpoIIIE
MSKKNSQDKSLLKKGTRGLYCILFSLFLLLSLLSFSYGQVEKNWLGILGYGAAWAATYLLGLGAFGIVFYLGWVGWGRLTSRPLPKEKTLYFFLFLLSCCILLNACAEWGMTLPQFLAQKIYSESISFSFPYLHHQWRENVGGVPLYYLYRDLSVFSLQRLFSDIGIIITFTSLTLVSFILLTDIQVLPLILRMGSFLKKTCERCLRSTKENGTIYPQATEFEEESGRTLASLPPPLYPPNAQRIPKRLPWAKQKDSLIIDTVSEIKTLPVKKITASIEQKEMRGDCTSYQLPPLTLLNNIRKVDSPTLKKDLRRQAEILD